jgi:hypothetical protein
MFPPPVRLQVNLGGAGEAAGVAVGAAVEHEQVLVLPNPDPTELKVLVRKARHEVDGRVQAKDLVRVALDPLAVARAQLVLKAWCGHIT